MNRSRTTRGRVALALITGTIATTAILPATPAAGHRPPRFEGSIEVVLANDPASCDPLGGERCLLPFPNDYFTVRDHHTDTGRRVDLAPDATPANKSGVHIDPTEWNRSDGFSPGGPITVLLPGVDLERSGAAPITDMARSLDRDAPIVLIDARTRQAPSLLGRARRPRARRRPPAAVHPARREPGGRAPLHRRPPRPGRRSRHADRTL